jgi:REP element-mobilizing transposase RayT
MIPDEIISIENPPKKTDDEKRSSAPPDAPPRGPFWLQDARIADMVVNVLHHGERVRKLYDLYAWVIMPNHVHIILQPRFELPGTMRWLKGRTSRMANKILGRTGAPFWQDESFDHWIRSNTELRLLIQYVEGNPASAGLVLDAAQWRWSSAPLRQLS